MHVSEEANATKKQVNLQTYALGKTCFGPLGILS